MLEQAIDKSYLKIYFRIIMKPQPRPKLSKKYAGRLGGLIGGKARANSLSPERRTEIARKAAEKRWSREEKEGEQAKKA